MLYALSHFLRDKLPFIWDLIDIFNSCLFSIRYGQILKSIEPKVLQQYAKASGMELVRFREVPIDMLVDFFNAQPEEAYTYFKPHGFDRKSLKKLQQNRSFLAYILIENNRVVAYCFVRSFFMGKGFRGRMVSTTMQGKGLGKLMSSVMGEIAMHLGLRMYCSISPENYASLNSARATNDIKIIKMLENGYYYIECIPKVNF